MRLRMLLAPAVLAVVVPASATEKHWVIHDAELAVAGVPHGGVTIPWWDGWHISAAIEVKEVLCGPAISGTLQYRFDCTVNWFGGSGYCRRWPPPRFAEVEAVSNGIWLFRRVAGEWRPVGLGLSGLSRTEVEDYIRKYKLPSHK